MNLRILPGILFALGLSGCNLEIPNAYVCADKGSRGAFCAFTRQESGEQRLTKRQWDRFRLGMFCMKAGDFSKYQLFVEKACQQNINCVDEAKREYNKFKRKMNRGN